MSDTESSSSDSSDSSNEEKKRYHKNDYAANKKKILAQMKRHVTCEHCGTEIAKYHLPRHKRSSKCKRAVEVATAKELDLLKDKLKAIEKKLKIISE